MHHFFPKIKNPFSHLEKYEIMLHKGSVVLQDVHCMFCYSNPFLQKGSNNPNNKKGSLKLSISIIAIFVSLKPQHFKTYKINLLVKGKR